jgi:hypothetical protein
MRREKIFKFGLVFTLLLAALGVWNCDESSTDYDKKRQDGIDPNRIQGNSLYKVVSPYDNIDWEAYGQYKAALHVHTTRSDGFNTLSSVIEEYYRQGYDILSVTDHNIVNLSWTTGASSLTQERFEQIASGSDRGGRGMLRVGDGNEQSKSEHINTFYARFNDGNNSILNNIQAAGARGGLSRINHIGRYTHRGYTLTPDAIAVSNNPTYIQKYVDLFEADASCVGMEIMNRKDNETVTDRILWDNILQELAPDKLVWGFSDDDSHINTEIGISFNMFVMKSNTAENVMDAMKNGKFYAVGRVAKIELGEDFYGVGLFPSISSIEIDNEIGEITISGENVDKIVWISDGYEIVTTNGDVSTINLNERKDVLGSYVRAYLTGPGGIAFTQPFALHRKTQE